MPRRVIRCRADEVMAGDTIVVKEGRIRKFYHVCEIGQFMGMMEIIYNGRSGDFVKIKCSAAKIMHVREEY